MLLTSTKVKRNENHYQYLSVASGLFDAGDDLPLATIAELATQTADCGVMDKYKFYPDPISDPILKTHQANIFLSSTNYPHMRFSRDTLMVQKKKGINDEKPIFSYMLYSTFTIYIR